MVQDQNYQVQEVQLIYKSKFKPSERPTVSSSRECYQLLLDGWNKKIMGFIEEFKILLLNRRSKVIGVYQVSSGSTCATLVDPILIFGAAIKAVASSIVLCHNHPSGNLKPSQADLNLTSKLAAGGALLDIKVIDHLIISEDGYYSFADEGLI